MRGVEKLLRSLEACEPKVQKFRKLTPKQAFERADIDELKWVLAKLPKGPGRNVARCSCGRLTCTVNASDENIRAEAQRRLTRMFPSLCR